MNYILISIITKTGCSLQGAGCRPLGRHDDVCHVDDGVLPAGRSGSSGRGRMLARKVVKHRHLPLKRARTQAAGSWGLGLNVFKFFRHLPLKRMHTQAAAAAAAAASFSHPACKSNIKVLLKATA